MDNSVYEARWMLIPVFGAACGLFVVAFLI
jgi:hypothetical protein